MHRAFVPSGQPATHCSASQNISAISAAIPRSRASSLPTLRPAWRRRSPPGRSSPSLTFRIHFFRLAMSSHTPLPPSFTNVSPCIQDTLSLDAFRISDRWSQHHGPAHITTSAAVVLVHRFPVPSDNQCHPSSLHFPLSLSHLLPPPSVTRGLRASPPVPPFAS